MQAVLRWLLFSLAVVLWFTGQVHAHVVRSAFAELPVSLPRQFVVESTYRIEKVHLTLETPTGLLCNNDPLNFCDPIGAAPIPLGEADRRLVEGNNAAATAILQQYGGANARVWTPGDILGSDLKTSGFGLTNPGLSIPLYWTNIPIDSKARMRSQYPDIIDSDVALLEATRRNTVGAQMALASHGLLPERQRQRLMLRAYAGMLDLTTIAATIPFQVPSAATMPFIGSSLGTPLANSTSLAPLRLNPGAAAQDTMFTFRGDTRAPSVIFSEGFNARGTSLDLFAHAMDNAHPPSAFIPTLTSPNVAAGFADNIYVVRPVGGVNVNRALGMSSPFPDELEVAVPWQIAPRDIRGVTLPNSGMSLLNPYWQP